MRHLSVLSFFLSFFLSFNALAQNPNEEDGKSHNNHLIEIAKSLQGVEGKDVAKSKVLSYVNSKVTQPEWYSEIPFGNPIAMLDFLKSKGAVSSKLYSAVKETVDFMQAAESLSEIKSGIQQREAQATEKGLSESDLNTYYSCLAIGKHSADFWSAESQGSTNHFPEVLFSDDTDWAKVGACDLIGACVGGSAGSIGGAVVGAAGASAISLIMQN